MKHLLFVLFSLLTMSAYSQSIDTVYVKCDDVEIHTVLTQPENINTPRLAIIVAGSGPTDLNGNQPNMKNNSLLYLSDALVENGIATVRFDKRGIAKSAYSGFDESKLTIEQYANDVTAVINYFKEKGFKNIYVIGHSEGSLVGLISLHNTAVNGFVSLAGAGTPADVLLKEQLQPKLPPAFYGQVEVIIDSLKNGQTVSNIPPQLVSLFRPSVQPYLISWFKFNPVELIKTINCPLLIINGNKDIQVAVKEAELLHAAVPNSQLVIIDSMNHILKPVAGDIQENIATYTNPDLQISEELVENIVGFIKK